MTRDDTILVRPLAQGDASAFRRLRLEALQRAVDGVFHDEALLALNLAAEASLPSLRA